MLAPSPSSPLPFGLTVQEPDARVHHVPEAVIQELWHRLRFDLRGLRTTDGRAVRVIAPGRPNADGGPDFTEAHLCIGTGRQALIWRGDVEVHRTSGDWYVHRHEADPRYNRVILHVTLVEDRHTGRLRRADGSVIPEVVLYPRLQDSLRSLLHRFFAAPQLGFPCAGQWADVPVAVRHEAFQEHGEARLREQADRMGRGFLQRPALEVHLWRATLRALGYAPNADAMEALAERVPLARLRALPGAADREALLLGAAGLLPTPGTPGAADYAYDLRARFERLQQAAPVVPMPAPSWQRARLRPANAPERRIVQAAALAGPDALFGRDPLGTLRAALDAPRPLAVMRTALQGATPEPFWEEHVQLGRASRPLSPRVGRSRADRIIANAVLPALLLSAEHDEDSRCAARVVEVYAALPAESDRVTRLFEACGSAPRHALDAQGMHHLFRERCTQGGCLGCPIGRHLLAAPKPGARVASALA